MRAHTDPSPRRAFSRGFGTELAAGPPRLPQASQSPRSSPSRPPSGLLPGLPPGPLTRSASSRSPNLAGQGHDLSRPRDAARRRRPAPPGPAACGGTRVRGSAHEVSGAERGPQTRARPRRGLGLLLRHHPAPSLPLRPVAWGSRVPQLPSPSTQEGKGRIGPEEQDLSRVRCQLLRRPRAAGLLRGKGGEGRARRGARLAGALSQRRWEGSEERARRRLGRDPGWRRLPPALYLALVQSL